MWSDMAVLVKQYCLDGIMALREGFASKFSIAILKMHHCKAKCGFSFGIMPTRVICKIMNG